jgi:hypothetical protein
MGTWLDGFADRENMLVYECRRGDRVVGLGILGSGIVRRRGVFTSRQFVLNESTQQRRNMQVEYNELLCGKGEESAVTAQLLQTLSSLDSWEELRVSYGRHEIWMHPSHFSSGIRTTAEGITRSWVLPLSGATTVESILATMSPNRRSQLRRAIREFEKTGPLSVSSATDIDQAQIYFHSLGELHSRSWQRKGERGAFARKEWVHFHESLIAKAWPTGNVQLLKIMCGDRVIGYLYNLVWRGQVLMMQSGFQRQIGNVKRPGYVSHLLAMQHNATCGMRLYDFLPGNDEYKRVLANPGPVCALITFQRSRLKFQVERAALLVVRTIRRLRTGLQSSTEIVGSMALLLHTIAI